MRYCLRQVSSKTTCNIIFKSVEQSHAVLNYPCDYHDATSATISESESFIVTGGAIGTAWLGRFKKRKSVIQSFAVTLSSHFSADWAGEPVSGDRQPVLILGKRTAVWPCCYALQMWLRRGRRAGESKSVLQMAPALPSASAHFSILVQYLKKDGKRSKNRQRIWHKRAHLKL